MSQPLSPPPAAQPSYGQPNYGQAPYLHGYVGPYPPKQKRLALAASAKKGSMVAGAVSFLGLSIGWIAVAVPIIALVFFGTVSALTAGLESASGSSMSEAVKWIRGLWDLSYVWLIALMVVGLAIMAASFLLGRWILKAHGVNRPTAVSWSGFAVAVGAHLIAGTVLNTIGSLASPLVSTAFAQAPDDSLPGAAIVVVVVVAAIWIAVTVAIGMFSWWWMAHSYRPEAPIADLAQHPVSMPQPMPNQS